MTTRLEAALARTSEAEAAWLNGDYAAAARDFTLAAEQFEAIWHEMHGERGASPDAGNARRQAREAIQRRDAERARADAEGRKLDAAAEQALESYPTEAEIDAMNASLLRTLEREQGTRVKLEGKIGGWQD